MNYFKDFLHLRHHHMVDENVLDDLFLMERRTLVTLMLLETILLYVLTPRIGNIMFVWYGLTATLSLWRLYSAYDYKVHPEHYSLEAWHKKLVIQTWATAVLFSLLALFGLPLLNNYYQLFSVIVLAGVSIGVVRALPGDYRTAIGYLMILLFPLAIEMMLLMRPDTVILAFLIILYFFTEVSILLHGYHQSQELHEREEQVQRSRELLRRTRDRMHRFFEQSSDGIFSYDTRQKILDCNQAFLDMFSLRHSDVVGHYINDLHDPRLVAVLQESLGHTGKPYTGPYRSRNQKNPLWLKIKCSPLQDSQKRYMGGMVFVQDRTREHAAILELEHLASHDPLTHVFNRRGFMQYLNGLINKNKHRTHYSLLFYFDMDKFKYINDRFGHDVGDKVLIETAKRIRLLAGEGHGAIARLGGDEFCLVVPFISEDAKKLPSIVDAWLGAIKKSFETPYLIEGRKLDAGCSIGAVVIDANEYNVEKVIAHADIAMFQAKRSGQEGMVVYDADLGQRHRRAYEVQYSLEYAIEHHQLEMYYQPIISAGSGELVSAEALVRWHHPEKGLMSPAEFLPIAIETGQIAKVDAWVINRVLNQIAAWKEQGIFMLDYVAINVDTRSLLESNIVGSLLETMHALKVRGKEIRLEITESSLVDNYEAAQQIIYSLRHHDIGCAIDDFGTGYSSLSYLKQFDFEILKVDREFVRDMLERIENIAMVRTIIEMGRQFNYTVVVEGVETERQLEVIRKIDPNVRIQGYLISPPVAPHIFEEAFLSREMQAVS